MSDAGFMHDMALTEGVLGRRCLAWVIDAVIIGMVSTVLWVILFLFGVLTFGIGMPLLGGLWVIPTVYTFVSVASSSQATPGQSLCGLRVVTDDTLSRPNSAQALIYAVGFWLTMAAGVIWLVIAFFTRRNRCLHDLISGLTVVRTDAMGTLPGAWTMGAGPYRG